MNRKRSKIIFGILLSVLLLISGCGSKHTDDIVDLNYSPEPLSLAVTIITDQKENYTETGWINPERSSFELIRSDNFIDIYNLSSSCYGIVVSSKEDEELYKSSLYLYTPGGEMKCLVESEPMISNYGMVLSPDEKRVAYKKTERSNNNSKGTYPFFDNLKRSLEIVDADGKKIASYSFRKDEYPDEIRYSPSGKLLAADVFTEKSVTTAEIDEMLDGKYIYVFDENLSEVAVMPKMSSSVFDFAQTSDRIIYSTFEDNLEKVVSRSIFEEDVEVLWEGEIGSGILDIKCLPSAIIFVVKEDFRQGNAEIIYMDPEKKRDKTHRKDKRPNNT